MGMKHCFLGLLLLVHNVVAQSFAFHDSENGLNFQAFTDRAYDITYAAVFPPLETSGANRTEFIGEIIAPIGIKWVGLSLGGSMINSLLLVGWPNNGTIVASPRFASEYVQPVWYDGPKLTTFPSSHVNSTHWKWVFRCENCTSWKNSDGLNLGGMAVWSSALSTVSVDDPANARSTFLEHTDFGFWAMNVGDAHDSEYDSFLGGRPATIGVEPHSSTAPPNIEP